MLGRDCHKSSRCESAVPSVNSLDFKRIWLLVTFFVKLQLAGCVMVGDRFPPYMTEVSLHFYKLCGNKGSTYGCLTGASSQPTCWYVLAERNYLTEIGVWLLVSMFWSSLVLSVWLEMIADNLVRLAKSDSMLEISSSRGRKSFRKMTQRIVRPMDRKVEEIDKKLHNSMHKNHASATISPHLSFWSTDTSRRIAQDSSNRALSSLHKKENVNLTRIQRREV